MSKQDDTGLPASKWFIDPDGVPRPRFWNGTAWTDGSAEVRPEPVLASTTPPPPPPPGTPQTSPPAPKLGARQTSPNIQGTDEANNSAATPSPVAHQAQPLSLAREDAPTSAVLDDLDTTPPTNERSRGELNKVDNEAARVIKSLSQQYTYLADLTQHAPRELRQEFHSHVEVERNRILLEMPIEQLKDFADKVRTEPLIKAGVDMATLLSMGSTGFAVIPGIGPVAAGAINLALVGAGKWASEQEVRMPRPDELRRDQSGLLRAAAREVRARKIPATLVPQLREVLDELERELKELRKLRSRIRKLVGRGGSVAETQAAAELLHQHTTSDSLQALMREAQSAIATSQAPNSFDELVAEYGAKFADYGSVLDEVITELGGAGEGVVERARGGLPAQLARSIESTQLRLAGIDVHLRGYQEFGAQFMIAQGRVILGDEMGLGKTIQALAVMVHTMNAEQASRFLVVAPASLIANWDREIERRTDFETHILQGPTRDQEMSRWLKSGGIALTSFSSLIRLRRLDEVSVDFLIVDEAHYVKNPAAKRSKAVEQLTTNARRVVLMSGTPMENRLSEFENLVRITNPPFYSQVINSTSNSKQAFRAAVAPLYLRRNQADVLRELPERLELEEWVDLYAAEQSAHQQAVRERNMMGMRQAAIFGGGQASAKLERLKEILDYYEADGQKVLVFSYFLDALTHVQQIAPGAFRVDGSLSAEGKLAEVDRFSKADGHAVLVSQITAGGVGLNIQAASVVVLLEPQFKPTTEWQAIARAHRMGQSRRVMVHRLLARKCVDESLYELVGAKSQLFDDYARESNLKNASGAATEVGDSGLITQLMSIEQDRLVNAA